jgi:hypothetical protein
MNIAKVIAFASFGRMDCPKTWFTIIPLNEYPKSCSFCLIRSDGLDKSYWFRSIHPTECGKNSYFARFSRPNATKAIFRDKREDTRE